MKKRIGEANRGKIEDKVVWKANWKVWVVIRMKVWKKD